MPRPRRPARRMRKRRAPRRNVRVPRNRSLWSYGKTTTMLFATDPVYLASNPLTTIAGQAIIAPVGYTGPFQLDTWQPSPGASVVSVYPARSGLNAYYEMGCSSTFRLSDIAKIAPYTQIFDQYRINSIKVVITSLANQASVNGTSILPTMYCAVDYDGAAIPSNTYEVKSKAGSKVWKVGNKTKTSWSVSFKPKVALGVLDQNSALTGSAMPQTRSMWLDLAATKIDHYGVKLWFENVYLPTGVATQTGFQIETYYNVSFRGAQNLH